MVHLFYRCDVDTAEAALSEALGQITPTAAGSFVCDPIPHTEDGIRFFRWLALVPGGLTYPDVVHEEDGSETPVHRYAEGGYVSPDGEGGWAVFALDANGHMLEEAAAMLRDFVDQDWGRAED